MATDPTLDPAPAQPHQPQPDKKSSHESAQRIGWAFLTQYYKFLNQDASRLHCFYTKRSTLIHSTEGEDATACYGQQEIHEKITSLHFSSTKVYISNVDSQSSSEGGIIVQVLGEMSNAAGPWRKFAQTFFLAEQPNGYFVLNDICRFLREEGEWGASASAGASAAAATGGVNGGHADDPAKVEDEELVQEHNPPPPPPEVVDVVLPPAVEESAAVVAEAPAVPLASDEPIVVAPTDPVLEDHSALLVEVAVPESLPLPLSEPEPAVLPAAPAVAAPTPEADAAPAPPPTLETTPPPPPPTTTPAAAAAVAPAAPVSKTWASLAASNATRWGSKAVSSATVSSAAPPPPPEPVSESRAATPPPPPPPSAGPNGKDAAGAQRPEFAPSVLALTHAQCFVKGVVETVSESALRKYLEDRFGPLREMDIIRSKACAFIEFETLVGARRAIQASLRPSEGGEGGLFVPSSAFDGATDLIHIVTRKPQGERPPKVPGGSSSGGGGGGGTRGGFENGRGGRGKGVGGRGGRGGLKTAAATVGAK